MIGRKLVAENVSAPHHLMELAFNLTLVILFSACQAPVPVTAGQTVPTSQPPDKSFLVVPTPTSTTPSTAGLATITPATPQKAKLQEFSASAANHSQPEDVIQIVAGGSGGAEYGTGCNPPYTGPRVESVPGYLKLMDESFIQICGWQSEEKVELTVLFPDGSAHYEVLLTTKDQFTGVYHLTLDFVPGLDDPAGVYTYSLKWSDGQLQIPLRYDQPTKPSLFLDDPQHLVLYHFAPKEHVRLFAYKTDDQSTHLAGWQSYQVDERGRATIILKDGPELDYGVIGDVSGEVDIRYGTKNYVMPGSVRGRDKTPAADQRP